MYPIEFTADIEVVDEEEMKLTHDIVEQMAASARCAFERHRHALRDAHAKSNGILKGELVVHSGLPEELRQGIFSEPRTLQVVARLSSSPGDIHSDKVPVPRGFAVKALGVEGQRLTPSIDGFHQDFLMVNFPALAFGTLPKYKVMFSILEANANAPDTIQRLGKR